MTNSPGIEHHAYLPLAWQDAGVLTPQQIADWMRDNVIALQAIDAVESHTSQAHDRESERAASSDHNTVRLEAKVDLLLQWMGKLLLAQQPLPPATEFILGPEVVAWKCATTLKPGSLGVLSLYLAPNVPTPLMLPVEVISCADGETRAKLLHLTEDAQDWLDRTLFRYHRRALQARSQNPH
jgi:hypothetical protein